MDAVVVSAWDRTQKDVECDGKWHWLTKKRVQIRSEPELDQLLSPPLSLSSQHRRHSMNQRLHHPVLPCRCRHKTFRTSSWIHRWSSEHKNAESARERGQTRRHQVKSLTEHGKGEASVTTNDHCRWRKVREPLSSLLLYRPARTR